MFENMFTIVFDDKCLLNEFKCLLNEYLIIWVNTSSTSLSNRSRFLNPDMTCLLNESIMSTRLSNFIKAKKKKKLILTKLI